MNRWKIRSSAPRKAASESSVAKIDQPIGQPLCLWNQTKSAGEVRIATAVAARRSQRHCVFSSRCSSAESSPPATRPVLIV